MRIKKIIIVAFISLLLVGCEKLSDKEVNDVLLTKLQEAYNMSYVANGFGLAVFPETSTKLDEITWYKVGKSSYKSVDDLVESVNKAYDTDVAKNLIVAIKAKYSDIGDELYSTGTGGCNLGYAVDTVKSDLSELITVVENKNNEVIFSYKNKEYSMVYTDGNWKLQDNIFGCVE